MASDLLHELQPFVAMLRKSGLLEESQIDGQLARFHQDNCGGDTSCYPFAQLLIREGLLTLWQFEKLREGKWKGFVLDQYKLLAFHHVDDYRSYYTAQDTQTGERVILAVVPKSRKTPGDSNTYYEVQSLSEA